jgi:hypothetical protein
MLLEERGAAIRIFSSRDTATDSPELGFLPIGLMSSKA